MLKKIIDKLAVRWLKKHGCSAYMAGSLWDAIWADFWEFKEIPLKEKLWAYRRGFLSAALAWYPDLKQHTEDYLPNLTYYTLHPVNGFFSRWIDDKLTFRYIFKDFQIFFPDYYFLLDQGRVWPLINAPEIKSAARSVDDVLGLAERCGKLALKPAAGQWGIGFHALERSGQEWLLNEKPASEQQVRQFLNQARLAIVSEYLRPHPDLKRFSVSSPGTARLVFFNDGKEIHWVAAFMRFGTKSSGIVDNIHAGAVFCGIDLKDGHFFEPKAAMGYRVWPIKHHPDTGRTIEGTVPFWQDILSGCQKMLLSCPFIQFGGLDVIVSADGFKVIEINSFPDIDFTQLYYPLLQNPVIRRFFEQRLHLVIRN